MKKLSNTIKILKKSVHEYEYEGEEGKHDTRPTESIKSDPEVENLINSLIDKDISELRELWTKYFDQEIPKWNKGYLTKRLAYRI